MTSFQKKVLSVVSKVPVGSVLTYSQVAALADNPKASRAVGSIMAKNTDKKIPCHRVVKSDGSIGMYNGLQGANKAVILKKEGITFSASGKIILELL
jgi:O-6-methylguanine DNA methyltransferase